MKKQRIVKSPIKQRVLQYINFSKMTKSYFYEMTNITYGILESEFGITEDVLRKVISNCPDLSIQWLLTGEGEMIKQPDLSAKSKSYTEKQDNKSCGICIEKDNRIADLLERTKAQAQIIDKFMSTLPVSCTDTISNK
jgi:hypothetical protein